MTERENDVITTCRPPGPHCQSYAPGHLTHTIRATLAGLESGDWLEARVEEVEGLCLVLASSDGGRILSWHHQPLGVAPGSTVRVHPGRRLIEVGTGWISVAVACEGAVTLQ